MKLTSESKLFIGIAVCTVFLVVGASYLMTRPAKPIAREKLILTTTPTKGAKDAPHSLVVFSDFQCPACKLYSSVLSELTDNHPKDLLIAYRYFPLETHPQSIPSAAAAAAAGNQGYFWEMEKLLFANQERLNDALYKELAATLGMDTEAFEEALADPAMKNLVIADRDYGVSLGITATPTFFLDGIKLAPLTPANLVKEVEKVLTE